MVLQFLTHAKTPQYHFPKLRGRRGKQSSQRKRTMTENEIAKIVVDGAYHIHRGNNVDTGFSLLKLGQY